MIRIAAILAGGKSARMGGADKALIQLQGARLVDHVFGKLAGQAEVILISGPHDYGLGVAAVSDRRTRFGGPATGLMSVCDWVRANHPDARGFFTAPVDGPFLPEDLVARLSGNLSAFAADDAGVHPTFAYWTLRSLEAAARQIDSSHSLSLKRLAEMVGARPVHWNGVAQFANINSPDDLAIWSKRCKSE